MRYKILKWIFPLLFFFSGGVLKAEEATADASKELMSTESILLLVVGVSAAVVLLALCAMGYALVLMRKELEARGVYKKSAGILTGLRPIEEEHELLMDHDYDGIRELDNNLPPWWVYMFYATIVFAVVYIWYYHIQGSGNVQAEEYKIEMADAEVQMKLMANKVDENSVKMLTDPAKLENGKTIFMSNCKACHGAQGEGGVGPNLTDDYWLHGGSIQEIFKTVKYGVPAKGMISWQSQLGPSQIQEVSSYIKTLRGTNPPNGKAPQGELVKE